MSRNTGRLMLEVRRSWGGLIALVVLIAMALGAAVVLINGLQVNLPWDSTYTVRVAVDDAKGVVPGKQQVRISGFPVGKISGAELVNGRPVLTLTIEGKYAPLYRNARVRLRPKTPLDDLYLNVEYRGTPSAGKLTGDEILPAQRTVVPVDIGRVLDAFDGRTRVRLKQAIDGIGAGLADHGQDFRGALVELAPFLKAARRLTAELAQRRATTAGLVHNLRVLTEALGSRDAQLRQLVSGGAQSLDELASVQQPLSQTLLQLPPTLAQLLPTFTALRATEDQLDPALNRLEPTATALPGALRALQQFSVDATPALTALRQTLPDLQALVTALKPTAFGLSRDFSLLQPQAPRLDRITAKAVPCELAIDKFFNNTLSLAKFSDTGGAVVRGQTVSGLDPNQRAASSCAGGGAEQVTRAQRFRAGGLVLFFLVTFAVASIYFRAAGTNLIPAGSHYTAQAVVPTAVALAVKADVREAGVNIGKVDQISGSGPTGADSLIKFELDSHSPIYRDAKVYVRTKSVAGENYLELDPGTPGAGALPSGGMLTIATAQQATQIDQILSIFDQARQHDLQRALDGLGGGLENGGGNLNATLEAADALPHEGSAAAAQLARDRSQLASLIDTFGTVARALGDRRAAIQLLTRRIKVAAQAVAARDVQLREVLDRLPPFLTQARSTADHLRSFSLSATPVVHNLRVAAQDLVPTVRVLLPAARLGRVVVDRLRTFAVDAGPALNELRPFAGAATALVPSLVAFVRQTKPLVTYMAPYRQEVSSFFSTDAASLQPSDYLGHVGRIILPVSISNLAGVLNAAQVQLLQRLDAAFDSRGHNAYPAPGRAAATLPFSGAYPHLQPDPPYGG